ncbi:uncharacterized protein F5891DRAFT_1197815 [Suillus fuscotomentosus]|uniref:JmjC domain-containing protein n=1 Tax=Suillus fuscotomentosus TaxID=1912939 RepID=A0AAD4HCD7_9AGAM|nr:uncharacterized protein F5891DRAFT_1197815 [Suillus fuscotomentosus]KAG1890735.1 hypothetical protein F5891DRAFT_1197815 [Suillus fuscotomentosus]
MQKSAQEVNPKLPDFLRYNCHQPETTQTSPNAARPAHKIGMTRAVSPERKREYNRRYERKLPPEAKQKRRDAQAACKRKLRQHRSTARALAEPPQPANTLAATGILSPAFSWTPSPVQDKTADGIHSQTHNFPQHAVASANDPGMRGLDLASGMLGTQVPLETEVVTWDDGHITILPTIMRDGQNILIEDLRLTKKLAAVPASKSGSKFVTHLNGAITENELLLIEIRSSLAAGKCVIVHEAVRPGPLNLTMEYLEKRYGIHATMPVDIHDMELQAKHPAQPHVPGVMRDLILGINNQNEHRYVLDCPIAVGLPPELVPLDEGQMAWHRTIKDCPWPWPWPGIHLSTPCASVSQGGVLIPPCHDSKGQNAYFFPVIGIQLRTLLFPKIPHDGKVPFEATKFLCSPHDLDDYDAETVTVYPGDLLIQPPGQLHAEYNPNPVLAHGGHFFTYGTLYHTHSSRSLEVTPGNNSQAQECTDETLWRMAALIPWLPPDKLLGKCLHAKPLLALCSMVLKPRKYMGQSLVTTSHKKKQPIALRSSSYTRACAVVTKILQHLDICPQDLPAMLKDLTSFEDMGEVIDLGRCLSEFTHTV